MNYKAFAALALMGAMTLSSCQKQAPDQAGNPLLQEFTAPYGIAPFEQITTEHFREAILKGLEEHEAEIQAIIDNPEEPNFANTIAAYDQAGKLLQKVQGVFGPLNSSNSTEEKRALQKELSPIMSKHSDDIAMNPALFARIKTVYDKYQQIKLENKEDNKDLLTHEQEKCLDNVYKSFVKRGAELSAEDQAKLRELNLELSKLQLQFSQNLLHETNNTFVTVDTKEELAGLPESNIESAAAMAAANGQEGKYMFNMQRPSCNPVLQYCTNRDLRKKVYDAYYNRGNQGNEWDNKAISARIIALRLEKAKLFGYKTSAEQLLEDRMAKNSENVYDLLNAVWGPAVAKANEELADIKAEMKKDGLDCEPEGWDYMFYSARAKAAKYSMDEAEIAQYFEINNVIKGIQYVAGKLYGLKFVEITDKVPSYEKTAQAWQVIDKDGSDLAVFFSDYYPRDGKNAGAWCSGFRGSKLVANEDGTETREIPITVNVCNMTIPSGPDNVALQSPDNVETMFHEFGHALHNFMRCVHYNAVGGTERDFVELPSQINEHWATEPEVLAVYAKHYKTGEIIPQELIQKMDESGKYGQGFATVEYVAASLVDMDLHCLTEVPADLDVMKFEEEMLAKRGIPRQILPRYRVTNFSHSIGGGYSAGYYSYLWAEVLDCDAFETFKNTGDIFNQEVAGKFRKYVLTPGGIDDGMTMYKNFAGHEPKIDALLRNRGLSAGACR